MDSRNNDLEEHMISNQQQQQQNKAPQEEEGNIFQKAWRWYKKDPIGRWPFLFFLLLFPVSMIYGIWWLLSKTSADYAAFASVIIVAAFGSYHFRILMKLKEEVDRLHKLNAQFRQQNSLIKKDVNRLSNASNELTDTSQRLRDCNERNRQNIKKFQQLSKNLKTMGVGNVDSLKKIQDISSKMNKKWTESLLKHHRQTLTHLFDKLEFQDEKEHLGKNEFENFLKLLPKDFQQAFHKMGKTFEDIAGDDNVIDIKEFTLTLDEWVDKHMSSRKLSDLNSSDEKEKE